MSIRDLVELARIQLRREEGQTMAEYGLLIALVAIVLIGAVTAFSGALNGTFSTISGAL